MRSHGLSHEGCIEDLEETMALYLSERGDSGSGPLCRPLCRINRALGMAAEVLEGCGGIEGLGVVVGILALALYAQPMP